MPRAAAVVLFLFWACAPCVAQSDAVASPESRLPAGIQLDIGGDYKIDDDGNHVLTGGVTLLWRNSRIQADRMSLSEGRYVEAEGDVLIVWGDNRIFGTRMSGGSRPRDATRSTSGRSTGSCASRTLDADA